MINHMINHMIFCIRSFGITRPNFGIADQIITDAIIIAIISFVINISQAKLLAKKNSYTVHPDQVKQLEEAGQS